MTFEEQVDQEIADLKIRVLGKFSQMPRVRKLLGDSLRCVYGSDLSIAFEAGGSYYGGNAWVSYGYPWSLDRDFFTSGSGDRALRYTENMLGHMEELPLIIAKGAEDLSHKVDFGKQVFQMLSYALETNFKP